MRMRENIHQYGEDISLAKLDGLSKGLLWQYAFEYDWEAKIPSRLTEREICSMTGMAQSTYFIKRNYLEALSWIKVEHNGFNKPCSVYPLIGEDDPDYETRSWASWHPLNHTYLALIRSEQKKMVLDGIDVPFSKVCQLFEDDDELYASFLEEESEEESFLLDFEIQKFLHNIEWFSHAGYSINEQLKRIAN